MHKEEITFAELTALVKAELQFNPANNCQAIANKYGISDITIYKFIKHVAYTIN